MEVTFCFEIIFLIKEKTLNYWSVNESWFAIISLNLIYFDIKNLFKNKYKIEGKDRGIKAVKKIYKTNPH